MEGGISGPFGRLSWALPGSVLQALIGSFDSRSDFGSSLSSSSSFDGTDGSMSQNNFSRPPVIVLPRRSVQNEKISRMNRKREISGLTVRMVVASAGGTLPHLTCHFLRARSGWRRQMGSHLQNESTS
jgi:hypothetical protein